MGDNEREGAAGAETSDIGAVAAPGRDRRMSAGVRRDAVLRVQRGESLEIAARELGLTVADLSGWRDAFLEAGSASLKSQARDDRDATIDRLRTKVGEMTMGPSARTSVRWTDVSDGRTALREDRADGGWRRRRLFCCAEIEAMSAVMSISTRRRYGFSRICRVWGIARAGVYRGRRAAIVPKAPRRRPGPQGPMPDAALVEAIRRVLTDSPFSGEG